MTEIPVAVVGAGPWGRTISAAISVTPGICLTAIVSSQNELHGVIDQEIPILGDWREAAEKREVSGFILAIPPMHQTRVATEMIESRIPVMLEKPMAASVTDAARIQLAAASHGFCGLVNHLHVHSPAFKNLLLGLSEKRGPITICATAGARGPYRANWSPLWDWAPHDLAMALSVIKSDPVQIFATQGKKIAGAEGWYRNYFIELTFLDASRANLHVGNAFERKLREFTVTKEQSKICYRESETNQISVYFDGMKQPNRQNAIKNRPLNAALITFADRIRNGGGIEDIKLGMKVVRLIDAAENSIRAEKPIALDQIWRE